MKQMENYYELSEELSPINYKKKKALLNVKELFNRIIKYKYGKFNFKKDITLNSITFMNNFANNSEINEAEETKINDFTIDVKNANVNANLQRKNEIENEIEIDDIEFENEDNENVINININENDNNDEDNEDNEDDEDDEDDEYYKKDPIEIGKETKIDEMEELK
jgi:hypothetical protein